MRNLIIILLTILLAVVVETTNLFAFSRPTLFVSTSGVQNSIDTVDTSKITVLPLKALYALNDSAVAISLTSTDYIIIDSILKSKIAKFNSNEKSPGKGIRLIYPDSTAIQLKYYYQQYIPYSLNSDRIVFVNCFKETQFKYADDWKKSLILADGGGKSFFQAEINLSLKTCISFGVNGPL